MIFYDDLKIKVIEKIKLLWDFSILSDKIDSFDYYLKIIHVYFYNTINKENIFLDYLHLHEKIEDYVNIQRISRIIDEIILKFVQILSSYRIDLMSLRRYLYNIRKKIRKWLNKYSIIEREISFIIINHIKLLKINNEWYINKNEIII